MAEEKPKGKSCIDLDASSYNSHKFDCWRLFATEGNSNPWSGNQFASGGSLGGRKQRLF